MQSAMETHACTPTKWATRTRLRCLEVVPTCIVLVVLVALAAITYSRSKTESLEIAHAAFAGASRSISITLQSGTTAPLHALNTVAKSIEAGAPVFDALTFRATARAATQPNNAIAGEQVFAALAVPDGDSGENRAAFEQEISDVVGRNVTVNAWLTANATGNSSATFQVCPRKRMYFPLVASAYGPAMHAADPYFMWDASSRTEFAATMEESLRSRTVAISQPLGLTGARADGHSYGVTVFAPFFAPIDDAWCRIAVDDSNCDAGHRGAAADRSSLPNFPADLPAAYSSDVFMLADNNSRPFGFVTASLSSLSALSLALNAVTSDNLVAMGVLQDATSILQDYPAFAASAKLQPEALTAYVSPNVGDRTRRWQSPIDVTDVVGPWSNAEWLLASEHDAAAAKAAGLSLHEGTNRFYYTKPEEQLARARWQSLLAAGAIPVSWAFVLGGRVWILTVVSTPSFVGTFRVTALATLAVGLSVAFVAAVASAVAMRLLSSWFGRALEERARQVETLEQAKAELTKTLGWVVHELRNPLHCLSSAARLVARLLPHIHPAREWVEVIVASSERVHHLIGDMLNYSDLLQGRFRVVPSNCDVRTLTRQLAQWHRSLAHVPIHWEIAPSVPQVIHADYWRILQVLSNGLTNACKFCDPDGEIRILVTFSPREPTDNSPAPDDPAPNGYVVFSITNTVPAIEGEDIAIAVKSGTGLGSVAFAPLDTLPPRTLLQRSTRKHGQSPTDNGDFIFADAARSQGAGLGLSIALEVARQLGTKLTVRHDGGHVTYTLQVPFVPVASTPTHAIDMALGGIAVTAREVGRDTRIDDERTSTMAEERKDWSPAGRRSTRQSAQRSPSNIAYHEPTRPYSGVVLPADFGRRHLYEVRDGTVARVASRTPASARRSTSGSSFIDTERLTTMPYALRDDSPAIAALRPPPINAVAGGHAGDSGGMIAAAVPSSPLESPRSTPVRTSQRANVSEGFAACNDAGTPLRVKCIYVDDDRVNRQLFRVMMRRLGNDCIEFKDALTILQHFGLETHHDGAPPSAEASERTHRSLGTVDVAFIDLVLPGMNGHELLLELRRQGYTGPAVAVTGAAIEAEDVRSAGFDEVLTKPFSTGMVDACVRRVKQKAVELRGAAGLATQPLA